MKREVFRPRVYERIVFAILALLLIGNGAYLVGPWYLEDVGTTRSPLYALFSNAQTVAIYGTMVLIDGIILGFAAVAKPSRRATRITTNALLAGFLLRLYALIGVFLTLDSWRPPSYLSQIAIVILLGATWLWVKIDERPTE